MPVSGWIDTAFVPLKTMPAASDLLQLTDAQWEARLDGHWAVSAGALVPYTPPAEAANAAQLFALLQRVAVRALAASDRTVLRCVENGVTVPPEWVGYRAELRNIVNGTNGSATALPTKPNYPAGT